MSAPHRLYILDANALLHRAWHALPPLTSPDGQVVNAVYGVLMVVLKLLNDKKPDAFVACWDTKAPTFRHTAFVEYKAQREKQADELYEQIPLAREGLDLLGIPSLSLDGFEADDLIGTFAVRSKALGWEVTIVTGDRDALQLVQPGISVLAFKKGVSETILYDEEEVKKQYSLTPRQFLDYKALRGDPSDNIPGVKGIGEVGATDLLTRFGSLDGIVRAAHDASSEMKPSTREKILESEKELPAILSLVKIVTDVPIEWEPVAGTAIVSDLEKVRAFLLKYGFKTLVGRLPGSSDRPSDMTPSVGQRVGQHPPTKRPTAAPSDKYSDVTVSRPDDAVAAFSVLRKAPELVVHVAKGAPGSLFAGSVEGVLFGAGTSLFFFTGGLIERSPSVRSDLKELLENPTIAKIGHDTKEQMRVLDGMDFDVRGWSFDTMLGSYLLGAGERNHDLFSVATRIASMMLPEDASVFRQAEAITRLAPLLRRLLKEDGLDPVFSRFELPLVPVLRAMEREGIMIDEGYLHALSKEMQTEKDALEKKMIEAAGRPFNPASPSQLADILFVDLKIPTKGVKKGKTGYSTAAPELEKLHGVHPLIEMVEEYREVSKLLSTYVDVLPTLADQNGRVHTTYNQAVTATGRLSSQDPNLQNIPARTEAGRKIRRAFIAKPGFQLLSCDYSQIELRLVAALAKDEKMLEAFRHGDDIHTATAAAIWNIKKEDVTKQQRSAAKAINFGIIYGQGPNGLAVSAGITFVEAKKFIAAYFDVYRGIKTYMDETKALAAQLGYVETLFGRRRPLPEIQSMLPQLRAQAERMAINMPVQGTCADLMKLAMISLADKLSQISSDSRMLLQVHDEVVFEVPDGEVEKVAKFAREIMENIEKVGVPLVVDAKAGGNWEEMGRIV